MQTLNANAQEDLSFMKFMSFYLVIQLHMNLLALGLLGDLSHYQIWIDPLPTFVKSFFGAVIPLVLW